MSDMHLLAVTAAVLLLAMSVLVLRFGSARYASERTTEEVSE